MRNKIKKIIIILSFLILISFNVSSNEQFNFDVTEVEILDNGNEFRGIKRGTITSENGVIINADKFIYYKITNILNAEGNVEILDDVNNYKIYSDKVTYFKNEEKFITKSNSKAINNKIFLNAKYWLTRDCLSLFLNKRPLLELSNISVGPVLESAASTNLFRNPDSIKLKPGSSYKDDEM